MRTELKCWIKIFEYLYSANYRESQLVWLCECWQSAVLVSKRWTISQGEHWTAKFMNKQLHKQDSTQINIQTIICEPHVVLLRVWLQLQRLRFHNNCIDLNFHRLQVVKYRLNMNKRLTTCLVDWKSILTVYTDFSYQVLLPFHGHYPGLPALAGTPS